MNQSYHQIIMCIKYKYYYSVLSFPWLNEGNQLKGYITLGNILLNVALVAWQ